MVVDKNLVDKLSNLSPEELEVVLEALKKRLERYKQLKVAQKIIDKYEPALKELAK